MSADDLLAEIEIPPSPSRLICCCGKPLDGSHDHYTCGPPIDLDEEDAYHQQKENEMSEATPGPWHWNGIATIWNTKGHPGEVEREVIVAQVVCDYGNGVHVEPIPVREANVRLMESMVPMGYFTSEEWEQRLEAARAALAKARGK